MLKMCFEIQIGSVRLLGVESVSVESSVDLLADQATIQVPGMVFNKAYDIESKIKRGDKVVVKLGYDDDLHTEFTGYLKTIQPNSPLKLECEDSIYLFRRPVKDKAFTKTNVKVLLQYVLDQVNASLQPEQKMRLVTDLSGLQFDKFTLLRASGFEALEKLKQETGIAIYCRGNELHAHLRYTEKRGDVTYDFARNVEQSDGLEYVKATDLKYRVKVVGRTQKGANVEVEVGEPGGDLRTFQRPTISDKATLEKVAKEELKKLSYDGYKGAIKGWLIPVCEIGYSAKLVDQEYPERSGTYFVNSVKTEFSSSGGRRTVTLGLKLQNGQ